MEIKFYLKTIFNMQIILPEYLMKESFRRERLSESKLDNNMNNIDENINTSDNL